MMATFRELSASPADLAILRTFYESVYAAEFPDPDERESLDNLVAYLRLKARGWYGRNNYHIVIATEDDRPIGGSIADFLAEPRGGVIEFLVVAEERRRLGLGRALLEYTERLLSSDATQRAGQPLAVIAAEINDPFARSAVSDNLDPAKRALIWDHWGYRGLDLPYVQPPLSDTQGPVRNLILIARPLRPDWHDGIPAATVRAVIRNYLHWAMRIDNPENSREYQAMAAYLDHCETVRTISLSAYLGRDSGKPLHIHEVQNPDDPDFPATMAVYRAAFGHGPLAVDEVGFRRRLESAESDAPYHLWALRRTETDQVEGLASFFSLPSAGFGGYLVLSGGLRGRLRSLVARIEEQMMRDEPSAQGWYIETDQTADITPFRKVGFGEIDVDYRQPALRPDESPTPTRLLFKSFGRSYERPRLAKADVLRAVEEILRTVYRVAAPRHHPTYAAALKSATSAS